MTNLVTHAAQEKSKASTKWAIDNWRCNMSAAIETKSQLTQIAQVVLKEALFEYSEHGRSLLARQF
jgi:hypothetical protein